MSKPLFLRGLLISAVSRAQILEILQILFREAREKRVETAKIAHFLELVPLLLGICEENHEKKQAARVIELVAVHFPSFYAAKVQIMQLFHRELAVRRSGFCRNHDFLRDFLDKSKNSLKFRDFSDFLSPNAHFL